MKRPLLFLVLSLAPLGFAKRDADDILSALLDAQRGAQTMRGTVTMTVTKPDREQVFEMALVSDGDARSLIRVTAPPRDAGQAFLRSGDDLFLYNPRLRRVLRLPPSAQSDSFLGSDLSYSDLSGRDLETDYTAEITNETRGEDGDTAQLTLTPAPTAPTPYGGVVIDAGLGEDGEVTPLRYTFYDQRGAAVRRITFSEVAQVEGVAFPTRLEVENLLREGERTVLLTSDYTFGAEVPERCFTQAALERGC